MKNRRWEAPLYTSPAVRGDDAGPLSIETVPSEMAQIVESVFATMLNLEVTECGTPWFPAGDRLTSYVHLAGDWHGAVLLECDRGQACRFAGRFLSTGNPPEPRSTTSCATSSASWPT